ncbi:MAG: hypothetical protein N3G21_05185 [Candidatus Hydrogenedentes bacterium]|nr:hypothetical protein [Candidatus Hydrogenedentota bacterium]
MNEIKIIVQMLKQLLKDMEIVSSQGSGYYTCVPFLKRYNKLLEEGQRILSQSGITSVIRTFEPLQESDPKDPSDKSKVLLSIRVETSQLITLLEMVSTEDKK